MLVPVIASGLVSVLLVASGVHAANSRVTCSKHLGFAANKEGLDPCAAWAEMRNVCDSSSSSDVTSLTTGYSSYPAPSSSSNTHDCDCNYEAYNNMAACMLCQGRENWVSLNTWRAGCADFDIGFLYGDAYKIDASEVTDISINMPASVRIYRPTGTWDPEAACRISFSDWDECDSLFGATSTGKGGGSNARPTGRPSSSSIYDELEANTTVLWIVVAVCVALPALLSLIALIVCCVRQKNRKKFYGPLAAYYRSGGAPPPSAFNQGGLLANHYQSQSAVLHSQHSQYTSVSTDAPKYDAGSFGGQPYDPPKAFAGQAYDPPQQQFPGQQYQQYQYGDPYKA